MNFSTDTLWRLNVNSFQFIQLELKQFPAFDVTETGRQATRWCRGGEGHTAPGFSNVATTLLLSARHELNLCKIRGSLSGAVSCDMTPYRLIYDHQNPEENPDNGDTYLVPAHRDTYLVPLHRPTRRHILKRLNSSSCFVSMANAIGYRPFIMESGV